MAFTHNPKPAEERFREKIVVDESGCWLWTGHVDGKGYGIFGITARDTRKAHRFSYELHVGEIPPGLVIDHKCRVRRCVNPDHLEPVTNRVNVIRGNEARPKADRCKRGHLFDEANTYHRKDGRRECRACRQAAVDRYLKRRA